MIARAGFDAGIARCAAASSDAAGNCAIASPG